MSDDLRSGLPPLVRSRLAAISLFALALYWLAMFVGTHIPMKPTPASQRGSLDKVQHLTAFAGLTMLLCVAGAVRGTPNQRLFPAVLGIVALYGALDEWSQRLVPSRSSDFADWL